jgi:hypothetical protein
VLRARTVVGKIVLGEKPVNRYISCAALMLSCDKLAKSSVVAYTVLPFLYTCRVQETRESGRDVGTATSTSMISILFNVFARSMQGSARKNKKTIKPE